ncbi:unnamed protein product [Arctogadus glacialis]
MATWSPPDPLFSAPLVLRRYDNRQQGPRLPRHRTLRAGPRPRGAPGVRGAAGPYVNIVLGCSTAFCCCGEVVAGGYVHSLGVHVLDDDDENGRTSV